MRRGPVFLLSLCCLATMTGAGLAQSVGVAAAVNQSALGTAPSARPRVMSLGDKVIHNEKIETNSIGLLQILLADGTSFTVGPNSSMAIDSFVYDPDAGTAKVVATLGKGVFRFIGGQASKSPDGAVLNTPVGTVGIRGGISDMDFKGGKGRPFHIDMIFGQSITLTNHGVELGHIYQPGYSIAIGANGQATVQKTPPGWTASFQQAVAGHGDQHGGASHGATAAIASALSAKEAPGAPTQPAGPTTTTPAIATAYQPPPPFTPPDDNPATAKWAEINSSDLANAYAIYTGDYQYAFTTDVAEFAPNLPPATSGQFELDYHFGEENGGGTMNLDDALTLPVTPLSADPNTPAQFGFHQDFNSDSGPYTYSGSLDLAGAFSNTQAGAGHGVSGTFGETVTGTFPTDGGPISGSVGVDGTFSGGFDHISAP